MPERVLFTLVILGGALGALAGMLIFRHKTRKKGFWLLVGLSCAVHLWIWFFLTPSLAE